MLVTAEGGDRYGMLAHGASPHGALGVSDPKKYSPVLNLTEGEARREICAEGAMFTSSASVASTPSAAGLKILNQVTE